MLPMVQEAYVINMMGKYGRNLLTYSSFQRKIQDPSGMQTPYFLFIYLFFFSDWELIPNILRLLGFINNPFLGKFYPKAISQL